MYEWFALKESGTFKIPKDTWAELILGLRPANERRRYKVTPTRIDWAQN